jgi:hypothetical protein
LHDVPVAPDVAAGIFFFDVVSCRLLLRAHRRARRP